MSTFWGDRIRVKDTVYYRGYPNKPKGIVEEVIEDHKTGQTLCVVHWQTGEVELELSDELTTRSSEDSPGFFKPKDNVEDMKAKEKYDKERLKEIEGWKGEVKKERFLWASQNLSELPADQANYVKLLLEAKNKVYPESAKFYDGKNGLAVVASAHREMVVKVADGQISGISYFVDGVKVNEYHYASTSDETPDNRVVIRANKERGTYHVKWGAVETEYEEDYMQQFIESQEMDWESVRTELDEKGELILGE